MSKRRDPSDSQPLAKRTRSAGDTFESIKKRYRARVGKRMKIDDQRLDQIRSRKAPRPLAEYAPIYDAALSDAISAERPELKQDLASFAENKKHIILAGVVLGRIRRDSENRPEAPAFDPPGGEVVFRRYLEQEAPILEKTRKQPRNRARAYTSEAKKLKNGQGWRAESTEAAAWLADHFDWLAMQEGGDKQSDGAKSSAKPGRKKNRTALSVERKFVNAILPLMRWCEQQLTQSFNARDEVRALQTIAAEIGVIVSLDAERLAEAIKSWNRTNTHRPSAAE